jgi:hypothetical protein
MLLDHIFASSKQMKEARTSKVLIRHCQRRTQASLVAPGHFIAAQLQAQQFSGEILRSSYEILL